MKLSTLRKKSTFYPLYFSAQYKVFSVNVRNFRFISHYREITRRMYQRVVNGKTVCATNQLVYN